MEEKLVKILNEMNKKFNELDQKLDRKFNELDDKITEVREQQCLFEQEYGTKIDAIFDAVTLELDKNLEKSEKIRKIEGRMDRTEANMFSYEKRISNLELNH